MYTLPAGTEISKEVVKNAIDYNEDNKGRDLDLWDYYVGNHKILQREKAKALKNNKLVINHAKYITKVCTGYLLGNPVEYQTEKEDIDTLVEQYKMQTISRLDKEIARDVSIFGRAYEYIYATPENDLHSKRIDVTKCIVVYDNTMEHKPMFAVIYEEVKGISQNAEYIGVMVIDSQRVIPYTEKLDPIEEEAVEHAFEEIPVIEYKNNAEQVGDFEDVTTLIDAYNTLQSDRVNDKEQLVEAILVLYGMTINKKVLQDLKDNRVMTADKGSKAEYLIKQMNESEIDILRGRIEEDIHKISMTPNLSDENFIGNSSGVAIRYKLINFEQNVSEKEMYFRGGLATRFKLYNKYLVKLSRMSEVPVYQVDIIFKRNLPQNDLETSQMINNLMGIVDQETLLSQLSFIEDASKIVEKVVNETVNKLNKESSGFGTEEPNKEDNTNEQE